MQKRLALLCILASVLTASAYAQGQEQPQASAQGGWIGVRIKEVTADLDDALNIHPARGALVASVDDRGTAKAAGIKPGDVIVNFDGHEIQTMRDLPTLVASTPIGKTVETVIIRDGQEQRRTIQIAQIAIPTVRGPGDNVADSPVLMPPDCRVTLSAHYNVSTVDAIFNALQDRSVQDAARRIAAAMPQEPNDPNVAQQSPRLQQLTSDLDTAFRAALPANLSSKSITHPLIWDDEIACFPDVHAAMYAVSQQAARSGRLGFPACREALATEDPGRPDPFTGTPLNLPSPASPLLQHGIDMVQSPDLQRLAEQIAEPLSETPITAADAANPALRLGELAEKFRAALLSQLPAQNDMRGELINMRVGIMNMRSSDLIACFPAFQVAVVMDWSRLKVAVQWVKQQQQEQQAKMAEAQAAAAQQDRAQGYDPISIDDFVLDGRDLASQSSKVSIRGVYLRTDNLRFLYVDLPDALRSLMTGMPKPRVPLLVDDATRDFRKQLLACEARPLPTGVVGGCQVTVLGHADICTTTNGFGASREEPCVIVEDGR